ncbi:ESPR-type extended signal peptide-containing protein, partial [Dialister micraerophilus]
MNRVYKLIWNNARNMYIAVSEIAKSHRKETLRGGKKTAAIFLAALYLCGTGFAANTVQAESNSPVLTDEQKNEIVDKVLEKLNNKTEQNKTNSVKYISVNSGNKEKKPADDSDNSKNDGAYGANSVAIGRSAKAAGQFSIALGFQSKAWNEASLSIGRGATTFNQSALAIGHEATALHIRGTAVGYYAVAGRSSIAVGPNGQALGMASVSLGEGSYVGDISFREAYKKRNNVPYYYINEVIAKDTEKWENYKNKFKEELKDLSESDAKVKLIALIMSDLNKEVKFSTAIGNQSIVGVSFGTALGFGSRVNSEKAVALGADSLAERSGNPVGYVLGEANSTLDEVITSVGLKDKYDDLKGKTDPDLPTYNELKKRYKEAVKPDDEKQALKDLKNWEKTHEEFLKNLNERKNFEGTWKGSSGVVSVGNKKTGMTRQITGVAAGSEDTDAVNVAQLKALNTKVDNNIKSITNLTTKVEKGGIKYFSVNPDNNKRTKPAKGSDNSKNDGAYGENSVAIGAFAEAADANTLALGWSVKALGQDSLALGTMVYSYGRNSNAVGNQAAALGEESSAFGNQAKAMDMGTTALGNNAMAIQNGSTAVGYQSLSTVSSTSMGTNSFALGQASLALGQRSYIGDTTFR